MWESVLPHFLFIGNSVVLEQQRNAPQRRKTDEGINYAAEGCGLAAADPCDKVKGEKAYASPVDAADDCKNQRNAIDNHIKNSFPPFILSRLRTKIQEIFSLRQK